MRKNVFLLLVFITGQLAFSQGIKVISNEEIPLPSSEMGYNPVLSPSGDYLLITGGDLKGLSKFDFATRQMQTITTDKGAGFDAQISDDGNTVVYRSQEYVNRLRYTSLKSINLTTGAQSEVLKATRNLEGFTIEGGTVLAVDNGKLKTLRLSGEKLKSIPAVPSVKQGQLYLTRSNKTNILSPAGTKVSYLWASVSPDGEKMVYYVIEHGKAYVSNVDGSNAVSLGTLRAPKWMGNDWVIGMVDADNGEVLTASKIVAVAANGKARTELTDSSVIATNPSVDAKATKVTYNTADGKVFLMKIETLK